MELLGDYHYLLLSNIGTPRNEIELTKKEYSLPIKKFKRRSKKIEIVGTASRQSLPKYGTEKVILTIEMTRRKLQYDKIRELLARGTFINYKRQIGHIQDKR